MMSAADNTVSRTIRRAPRPMKSTFRETGEVPSPALCTHGGHSKA
jgi:hypothetical protein